jgi:hypothetical protein
MRVHLRSVTAYLKALPFGANRDQHLHMLGSAIALELTGAAPDDERCVALYLGVRNAWPNARTTWRTSLSDAWVQGTPPIGASENVEVGLVYPGQALTTPHDGSARLPCRGLDVVTVTGKDGTTRSALARDIDWTGVRDWRTA